LPKAIHIHDQRPTFTAKAGINAQPPAAFLPIAIDGSKTPELIPDDVAYNQFLRAIAQPQGTLSQQVDRRESMIARVGLSKADHDLLLAVADNLKPTLESIDHGRKQWHVDSLAARSAVDTLKVQEQATLDNAHQRLLVSLTPDGAIRVDKHVREYVKKRIVVYGDQPR
jgi:hypothetical protein